MTVKICGMEYEVTTVDDPFRSDEAGQADFREFKIRISSNLCEQAWKETLCHEMVHAILYHLGYNEQTEDEQFVQALANAICQSFEPKITDTDVYKALRDMESVDIVDRITLRQER